MKNEYQILEKKYNELKELMDNKEKNESKIKKMKKKK
jgi:hypothetical protein